MHTWLTQQQKNKQPKIISSPPCPRASLLEALCLQEPFVVMLDVVVPVFRMNLELLQRVVSLSIPENTSTTFLLIVDNPDSPDVPQVQALESSPQHWGQVLVRVLPTNSGACAARNRGIHESGADWILFLDDDVVVPSDLLHHYVDAVRQNSSKFPHLLGVVGSTRFPDPAPNLWCAACNMSYLTFFYRTAERQSWCWWGVTANLCLRRTPHLQFRDCFPKTGGGEDIAVCLDQAMIHHRFQPTPQQPAPLASAPKAWVQHLWWDNGRFSSSRFCSWTRGDSQLLNLFPQLTYRTMPNVVEYLAVLLIMFLPLWGWGLVSLLLSLQIMAQALVLDLLQELIHYFVVDPHVERHRTGFGMRRVWAICCAWLMKCHVHWGHLLHQLTALRWANLCRRFDFHCGALNAVDTEKRRAWIRFSLQVAAVAWTLSC